MEPLMELTFQRFSDYRMNLNSSLKEWNSKRVISFHLKRISSKHRLNSMSVSRQWCARSQTSYRNCKLRLKFSLKIEPLKMNVSASTRLNLKTLISKEKLISWEKSWLLLKVNARGLIKSLRPLREMPKIRIKTFKLFLRLLKRPTIRSLPSKPSI